MDNPDGAPAVAGTTIAAPGRRCKVGRILDNVTPAQRDVITWHLYTDPASNPDADTDDQLAARLRRGGLNVGSVTLWRHRAQLCICTTHDTPNEAR